MEKRIINGRSWGIPTKGDARSGMLRSISPCSSGFGEWEPTLGDGSIRFRSLENPRIILSSDLDGLVHFQDGGLIAYIEDDSGISCHFVWYDSPRWAKHCPDEDDPMEDELP